MPDSNLCITFFRVFCFYSSAYLAYHHFQKDKKRGLQTFIFLAAFFRYTDIRHAVCVQTFPQFNINNFIQAEIKDQNIIFLLLLLESVSRKNL